MSLAKKTRKLITDPAGFLADSRTPALRQLGKILGLKNPANTKGNKRSYTTLPDEAKITSSFTSPLASPLVLGKDAPHFAVYSQGIKDMEDLPRFLQAHIHFQPDTTRLDQCTAILCWGMKDNTQEVEKIAEDKNKPLIRLEDGFIRSLDLGFRCPPYAIVRDDLGMYYDATCPSRIEEMIKRSLTPAQTQRARALQQLWQNHRVSKYNGAPEYTGTLPEKFVLVVDQTRFDVSVKLGLVGETTFTDMLQAALDENPDHTVILKVHPDVLAGHKKGSFDLDTLPQNPRLQIIGSDAHPVTFIEKADTVYVATSQMGFEALLWGKRVRCFGMPFYAGWGLTEDALPAPDRRHPATLEALIHAALIDYPSCLDPESGQRCEVETLVEWVGLQRRHFQRFPPTVYVLKLLDAKHETLRDFMRGSNLRFVEHNKALPANATVAVWGARKKVPENKNLSVIRVEDGFLRSVGLGASQTRPLSWTLDNTGIYYDSRTPSQLENILKHTNFTPDLLDRASKLREEIVANDLTKYNLASQTTWQRPTGRNRIILVPGQVEADASLAFGAPEINTSRDLLMRIRQENPDAYIVYKPHPDIVAGLRDTGTDEDKVLERGLCDEIITDGSITQLFSEVDEVHLLTSLSGFEALLRDKKVVTYGQPFYAGWGLTIDKCPLTDATRRNRPLPLDALVAATLILYPTYISMISGRFTTPEQTLRELLAWKHNTPINTVS